jgi:sugar lactone lactonase YvrE
VTTIAGNGGCCYSGDGGPATSAYVNCPRGIFIETTGVIYFSDYNNYRIRKIDSAGIITTYAGNGNWGSPTDGSYATSSNMPEIFAVVGDGTGKIYFADYSYHKIRVIDTTGILSTYAGTGSAGYSSSHEGIAATSASLYNPKGIWFDSNGHLYISDSSNHRIRKVNSATKLITTIAGTGSTGLSRQNGAPLSESLNYPESVCGDKAGNIFVVDRSNNVVRKIDPNNNIISTILGRLVGAGGSATEGVIGLNSFLNKPSSITGDTSGTRK